MRLSLRPSVNFTTTVPLCQMKPVHTTTSNFVNINLMIFSGFWRRVDSSVGGFECCPSIQAQVFRTVYSLQVLRIKLCTDFSVLRRATCPAHLISFEPMILILFGGELQIMKLVIIKFSPASCNFILLTSSNSLKHSFLKHTRSMLMP
jgi:hypothetical protein